jgi:hypothetical protein
VPLENELPNLALAFAEMVPAKIAKSPSQGGPRG